MTPAGFPHSDIGGSPDACSSPPLFAAYHVLPRRSVPRHPPCALSSLDRNVSSPVHRSFQEPRSRTTPFPHTRSCSLSTPTSPLYPDCQCSCFPSRHPGRRSAAPRAAEDVSGVEGMCANCSDARLVRAFRSEEPTRRSRKEVIQPQVPLRLPCYDFAPVIKLAFDRSVPSLHSGSVTGFGRSQLPWRDGRCVQGPGTYSPWCS
jgi:hypothetical protein